MYAPDEPDALSSEYGQGNKSGQIYGRLKSLIVFQKLPPRTPLEQNRIAQRFGVSTTPVREALILLANDGIIVKNGTRSYLTRALSIRDVQNDYQAALAIAKFCIESAVERFTPTGLRLLDKKAIGTRTMEAHAQETAFTLETLYERIAGLTENQLLVRRMLEFTDRTRFIRQLDLQNKDRFMEITSGMETLVQFLARGDVRDAVTNLERQYQRKCDLIPSLVKKGNLIALDAVDVFTVE
ncbi:GntR family transcriptional regulator [Mesorhizobium carmichaelinearum]|uniref:GntR family transcriptional regulator n=1 Tax=Mesorhizobium carmichaelinearum TaxID=1208188 RepID=UPI0015CAC53D|nr:GntR family transcriptional regulator [Mesorhizobium carmichaelinearum]